MQSGYSKHHCYADFTHRSFGEFIKLNNASALRLALLVSDFARQMAAVYEQFAKDIQTIIAAFKTKYEDLKRDRPTDTPSTILSAWDCLLHGTENDAQAHMDVAVLLMKNVHKPLEEVAINKKNQTQKLNSYRDQFEETMDKVEHDLQVAEKNYETSVKLYQTSSNYNASLQFHSAHNEYLCQLCASNRTIEEFQYLIPQVLEELEEIYIDTSNTVNIAMESHALMLLTKIYKDLEFLNLYTGSTIFCDVGKNKHPIEKKTLQLVAAVGSKEVILRVTQERDSTEFEMETPIVRRKVTPRKVGRYFDSPAPLNDSGIEVDFGCRTDLKPTSRVMPDSPNFQDNEFRQNLQGLSVQNEYNPRPSLKRILFIWILFALMGCSLMVMTWIHFPENEIVQESQENAADEQHNRFKEMLKFCRQVNPQLDISYFMNAINTEPTKMEISTHTFRPADVNIYNTENLTVNHLIIDPHTESSIKDRRQKLQKEAAVLTSYIKHNQDNIHTLMMICQRNLANHLYSKVYETQGDMCCKRNEIRLANLQLAAIRAQIEVLSPKQNGSVENLDQDSKKSSATIKSMWKKAFKNLKSTSDTKLTKKGSLIKKKQNSQEAEVEETVEAGEIDPVYSLLKCAADLPKVGKQGSCGIHAQCSGHHSNKGDSSSSTSKTTSPASSASHSPKNRRKKLNSRMKSFSLDTPEPSKHLLAIDEMTKKKSSSFTNTCFGVGPISRLPADSEGSSSPDEKYVFSAANLRKKFASSSNRASSLELEDKVSYSNSPKDSPKSQKKQNTQLYVVLYNFKGKEKDDLDLRAGWRVSVLDSSDPDWWKGKCNGKVGYFPATYLIPIQTGQRVFQVIHSMHLIEGGNGMKLHKDQIVLQIGDEEKGMIHIQAANKKQAKCPLKYLKEV